MVLKIDILDPNRDLGGDDPIVITQFNVSKAIKDSILVNYGECGLALSLGSFQGNFVAFSFVWVDFHCKIHWVLLYSVFAVKYVNPITKLCIIRTSREEYQKVWSAVTMVRSIGNCPVIFNLLDLSGKSDNYANRCWKEGNFFLRKRLIKHQQGERQCWKGWICYSELVFTPSWV